MNKNLKMNKIFDYIKKFSIIICQRHQNPDPDAIGSQHGLAQLIKNTFPQKQVYCTGEDLPGLEWLGKSDSINKDVYKNALVIVTDCPDADRISDDRYKTAKFIIKIDHHPLVDKFANYSWINPKKSSASEMIVDLAKQTPLKMDKRSAGLLYAGIVGDTGRFMFPGATDTTFNDVAYLYKFGINMNYINRKEVETNINITHLYGYLDLNLHLLPNGTAYYVVTKKIMDKFHIKQNDFITKNLPGNINGVVAWAMFKEADNNTLKISLRSHAPAINGLAKKYNGGGHALASGAKITDNTDTKANVAKVVHDLSNIVDEYNHKNK